MHRPTHNRILVKVLHTYNPGTLLIAQPNTDLYVAEVVATGPGRVDTNGQVIPCCCKPGDQILFHKASGGIPITVDADKLLLLIESDALLVMEPEERKLIAVS